MIFAGAIIGLLGIWIFLFNTRQGLVPWLLGVGLALMLLGKALAHDHNRPGLDGWYQGLRSPAGAPCCDGPGVDAVLPGPNRDGRTLVWPTWGDGKRTVRCFLPGAMT